METVETEALGRVLQEIAARITVWHGSQNLALNRVERMLAELDKQSKKKFESVSADLTELKSQRRDGPGPTSPGSSRADETLETLALVTAKLLRLKDSPEITRDRIDTVASEAAEFLEKTGYVPIPAMGARFNPALHRPVEKRPGKPDSEGVIVETVREGYYNPESGEVLIKALVAISTCEGCVD